MNRILSALLTGAMVAAALAAGGCCDKEKKQVQSLQAQLGELTSQNQELRTSLAQAKDHEAQLTAELSAKTAELDATKDDLRKAKAKPTEQAGSGTPEGWEKGLTGDRVSLGSDILFASGKADLTGAGTAALDRIVRDLKSTYAGMPVRVYGYTDTDPIRKSKWKDNLELSSQRAMAVTRHLVSKGIRAEAVETIGMGEHHPVAGNKTKSRRVEIVAVKAK